MAGVWLRGGHEKDTGRVESTHRNTLQSTIGNGFRVKAKMDELGGITVHLGFSCILWL